MKPKTLSLILLLISALFFSQKPAENSSKTRLFIEDADITRMNKDWSLTAQFRSGIGETVDFFPVQIINLKNGQKKNALEMDMMIKRKGNGALAMGILGAVAGAASVASGGNPATMTVGNSLLAEAALNDGKVKIFVDNDEVQEFINFIETYIVPNIETKYKEKSSEFKFVATEITLIYQIIENKKRLTIKLNAIDDYEFWTENRADKIGEILPVLKKVNSKELDF